MSYPPSSRSHPSRSSAGRSWTAAAAAILATWSGASVAHAQLPSQFHYGTMGAPHNSGNRPVLLTGIEFRDERLHTSRYAHAAKMFGTSGLSVHRHLQAMSFRRFGVTPAGGLGFYGPFMMANDWDTRADETLRSHAIYTPGSSAPILYMGIKAWTGRFLTAANGGGGGLRIGGQTSNADASATPHESLALVDLNGGRLNSGDFVGFKTPTGHWLRQSGQFVRADAPRAMLGVYFRIYKASGGGSIEDGDRFHLVAMNGRYVRAFNAYVTANATTPLVYGTFTLARTSIDSMRMTQRIISESRRRYRTNFSALDTDRDGVVEPHECVISCFLATPRPATCGANRGHGARLSVPGQPGVRVGTTFVFIGEDATLSTWTHELTHTLGTIDMYGAGGASNYMVSLMGATCDGRTNSRVHLDCWHKMRLGWVQPRIINMRGRNCAELLRATASRYASTYNRPIILYDPARYNLTTRSGEFFMIEARSRKAGYFDEYLKSEGVAVWQIRTDRNGFLQQIPAIGRSGNDSTCNLLSADGRRGGNRLFTAASGVIALRYIDNSVAPVRLRVSRPWSNPDYAIVEISPDGRMAPRIQTVGGSLRVGASMVLYGEFAAHPAANTRVWIGGRWYTPTSVSTTIRLTIPRTLRPGTYWVMVQQYGKYSNYRAVTIR